MSKEKQTISKQLAKCPFCNLPFKKIGSKRRGNQHYIHDKYMESNCIFKEFGFKASEENFDRWNTRKPMERIVERLEEEQEKLDTDMFARECDNWHGQLCNGISEGVEKAIEIVKEEGGINDNT